MSEVRERPMIFSGPMVRAIMDGRKTQTRRVVKPQPFDDSCAGQSMIGHRDLGGTFAPHVFGSCMAKLAPCPYGKPGDRLWVRETWAPRDGLTMLNSLQSEVFYRADYEDRLETDGLWRPSIHMPRWASRITLEITEVRVQRLNEISEADARAEGCSASGWSPSYSNPDNAGCDESTSATDAFAELWQSINAKRAPWESNPWIWALTFKRAIEEDGKS